MSNPSIVLKALLKCDQIQVGETQYAYFEDEVWYRYEGSHRENIDGTKEDVWFKSTMTLSEFIKFSNELTEEQIFDIGTSSALVEINGRDL